jgi:Icc-related predicted phosphoesterase
VLLKKIKELKDLKLVVFGHIHRAHGMLVQDGVTYVNAAMCGEGYKIMWDPVVVTIEK